MELGGLFPTVKVQRTMASHNRIGTRGMRIYKCLVYGEGEPRRGTEGGMSICLIYRDSHYSREQTPGARWLFKGGNFMSDPRDTTPRLWTLSREMKWVDFMGTQKDPRGTSTTEGGTHLGGRQESSMGVSIPTVEHCTTPTRPEGEERWIHRG